MSRHKRFVRLVREAANKHKAILGTKGYQAEI